MNKQLSREEKVEVFLGLKSHEERCAYFHDHPELATIFAGHHYPKPRGGTRPTEAPPRGGTRPTDDKTTVPKPK